MTSIIMENGRSDVLVVTDKFAVAFAFGNAAGFGDICGNIKTFSWRLPLQEALQVIGAKRFECAMIHTQNDIKIPSDPISLAQSSFEKPKHFKRKNAPRPDLKKWTDRQIISMSE